MDDQWLQPNPHVRGLHSGRFVPPGVDVDPQFRKSDPHDILPMPIIPLRTTQTVEPLVDMPDGKTFLQPEATGTNEVNVNEMWRQFVVERTIGPVGALGIAHLLPPHA
jgi:hypothetical protein